MATFSFTVISKYWQYSPRRTAKFLSLNSIPTLDRQDDVP